MSNIPHAEREVFTLPGITHRTTASHRDGLTGVEVWVQLLEPGAESPVHYHDCEEVIVVLTGSGRLIVDGEETRFGPDTTLIVPANVVHQLINDRDEEMKLVAALSATPNRVFSPDGSPIPVPWLQTEA